MGRKLPKGSSPRYTYWLGGETRFLASENQFGSKSEVTARYDESALRPKPDIDSRINGYTS